MGALGGATAYLVTTAGRVGIFWYLPYESRWSLAVPTGVIAMDWYARALWTLLGLGLAMGLGYRLSGYLTRPRLSALWKSAVAALLWCVLFTTLWVVRG